MEQFNLKKSYIPYLHILILPILNVIVIKNVAAISASFVSFRIKQTLFNTRKTSKSKFEIFHFYEEFWKDL